MMRLRIEARAQPSRLMSWLSPLIALTLTVIIGMLTFAALGKDPIESSRVFFLGPLRDSYAIAELLLKATPLMLCALGLAVGFQANVWNIGAEGQFIFGAIGATGVALAFDQSALASHPAFLLALMMLAGALSGALYAAIPAFLRTHFNANEILTSLMLVYVATLFASWLVFGPWKDPEGMNFPQTRLFSESALLPVIWPGTRLNLALPFALGLLVLGYVYLHHAYAGFKMRVAGGAESAARYAGYSARRMVWIGLLTGGATAGMAGMAEVAGPLGQLTDQIASGYGFAAIIVAFVGRLNPLGIALASVLMALFVIGGEQAQQHLHLPSSIAKVFQGLLLFCLLGTDLFINYRVRRIRPAKVG
jgi:general nucleoside transport system permease protein